MYFIQGPTWNTETLYNPSASQKNLLLDLGRSLAGLYEDILQAGLPDQIRPLIEKLEDREHEPCDGSGRADWARGTHD